MCVAGGTPQIITETLWALMKNNEPVDEIRVITTSEGRRKLIEGIIVDDHGKVRGSARESLLDPVEGQFYKFQNEFPKYAKSIRFDENCIYTLTKKGTGVPSPRDLPSDWMKDILTDEENEKIANQICEIVRELAADEDVRIHASIAGGRKTMGLYLMTAMQLFSKNDDAMSHVLVSKDVEFGAPLFFYKPNKPEPILDPQGKPKSKSDGKVLTTDDVEIFLADIPYIRLRGVGGDFFERPIGNYAKFVDQTQDELRYLEGAKELRIDLRNRTVTAGTRTVKLPLRLFFVYTMFACFRKYDVGEDGFVGLDEITREDLESVCVLFVRPVTGESPVETFRESMKRAGFISKLDVIEVREEMLDKRRENYQKLGFRSQRDVTVDKTEAAREVMNDFREALSRISRAFETCETPIDPRFDVVRIGVKGGYRFGLNVPSKLISIG